MRIRLECVQDMLIEKVMPVQTRNDSPVAAVVQLVIVIGKDGCVIEADPVAGPAFLNAAAVDAVRRWRYRPIRLNGFPVEVKTTVHVSFQPAA
jgi:protein TonB